MTQRVFFGTMDPGRTDPERIADSDSPTREPIWLAEPSRGATTAQATWSVEDEIERNGTTPVLHRRSRPSATSRTKPRSRPRTGIVAERPTTALHPRCHATARSEQAGDRARDRRTGRPHRNPSTEAINRRSPRQTKSQKTPSSDVAAGKFRHAMTREKAESALQPARGPARDPAAIADETSTSATATTRCQILNGLQFAVCEVDGEEPHHGHRNPDRVNDVRARGSPGTANRTG